MTLKFMELDLYPVPEVNLELKRKIHYGYFREVEAAYLKAENKAVRSFIFDKKLFDKSKAEAWLKERGIESLDFAENTASLQYGVRKFDDFMAEDVYDTFSVGFPDGISMMLKRLTPDALFVSQAWQDFQKVVKPQGGKFCVYSKDGSKKLGCHDTKEQALGQLRAIEANKDKVSKTFEKLQEISKLLGESKDEKAIEASALIKALQDVTPTENTEEDFVKSETKFVDNEDGTLSFQTEIPFLKALDEDKRIVYGVVYAPDKIDSQGDYATAEEIEKGAHNFMIDSRRIGIMHKFDAGDRAHIIENYIAPCDIRIGSERIVKGTWVMGLKITDDGLWKDIKSGKLNGLSMGGKARKG